MVSKFNNLSSKLLMVWKHGYKVCLELMAWGLVNIRALLGLGAKQLGQPQPQALGTRLTYPGSAEMGLLGHGQGMGGGPQGRLGRSPWVPSGP